MTAKPELTVVTVNYNTSDFIDLMIDSLKVLTKTTYKMIICDNGSRRKDLKKIKALVDRNPNIDIIFRNQNSEPPSVAHATALDLLIKNIKTNYFVVMDADAVFLLKYWDEMLINQINERVKAVGTPLHKGNHPKPTDFPLVFAVLYETATFKNLECSFLPKVDEMTNGKDTGWEIREKYHENNFNGKVVEARNTRNYQKGPFRSVVCTEYYYKDKLLASHFARGASNGYAKYHHKWYFKIPIVSRLIRKLVGKKEKRDWIQISRNIITSQTDEY